jgi:hypothetical protein
MPTISDNEQRRSGAEARRRSSLIHPLGEEM